MQMGKHPSQGSQTLNLEESRTKREETGQGGDTVNEARGCERAFLGNATSLGHEPWR